MSGSKRCPRFVFEKAGKILKVILAVFIAIALRVSYLAIVKHEHCVGSAIKSQKKTLIQKPERASLLDRSGTPLAINQLRYSVGINYKDLTSIPRTKTVLNAKGRRQKIYPRQEYIKRLALFLAENLNISAQFIEDQIYAKASIYDTSALILKEDLDETTFCKLKLAEKDYVGLVADVKSLRYYPFDQYTSEITGYIGPMTQSHYESVLKKKRELQEELCHYEESNLDYDMTSVDQLKQELFKLEALGYSKDDWVGQAGLEKQFDITLRGEIGKHLYLTDIYGNLLEKLKESFDSTPGKAVQTTISLPMQIHAQKLLAEYESISLSRGQREDYPDYFPWIRGGAIVALDPNNGEVLTLASFPRYSANDFIGTSRGEKASQWLENRHFIKQIWQGEKPLIREKFDALSDSFFTEHLYLDWESFLKFILPERSQVRMTLEQKNRVHEGLFAIRTFNTLVNLFSYEALSLHPSKVMDFLYQEHQATGVLITLEERRQMEYKYHQFQSMIEESKRQLKPYFQELGLNYDKLLLLDLYRLILDESKITGLVQDEIQEFSLKQIHQITNAYFNLCNGLKSMTEDIFKETLFQKWRDHHFKAYLAKCRKEEKTSKKAAKPFTFYLNQMESKLFAEYWDTYGSLLIPAFVLNTLKDKDPVFASLKLWREEIEQGAHRHLNWIPHFQKLKHLLSSLNPQVWPSFLKILRSFEQMNRPLLGKYGFLPKDEHDIQREYHLASAFYPREGFGFYRSLAYQAAAPIGSLYKVVPAYEALRQKWFDHQELNNFYIIDDKHKSPSSLGGWNVGYTLDGKPIPLFYKGGRMPRSDHRGIGKVDLIKALETSSNPFFALLAQDLHDPEDLIEASKAFGLGSKTGLSLLGEAKGSLPKDVSYNKTGLYALAIGQHTLTGTPIQSAVLFSALANGGIVYKPKITKEEPDHYDTLFLPKPIQNLILSGMKKVIFGEKGTARMLRSFYPLSSLANIVGKTSTAELLERVSLDGKTGVIKQKNIWFGAISFEDEALTKPELVVIVFLKGGQFGKDAAPYAVEMINQYRLLKKEKRL